MPNNLNAMPILVTTDIASFFAGQTLQTQRFGLRVYKIALVGSATVTAGSVTITEPNSGIALYPPVNVTASTALGTLIFEDNPTYPLQWRDFAVTGVTATGTQLYVWYRL